MEPIAERLKGGPTPDWVSDCGTVVLFNADCLEVLRELPSGVVDAVVTDPPYGINTKSDGGGKLNPWADLCNSAFWYQAWISEAKRIGACMWSCLNWRSLVTFQKAACDIGWPIESLLVWDKGWIGPGGNAGLRPSYELVALWVNGRTVADRGLADVQQFKWSGHKPNGHPAEKPESLFDWCLESVLADSAADPFMGSGTTGVAAVRRQRQFIGVELNDYWFEYSVKRITAELNRFPLLTAVESKPVQSLLIAEED